MAPVFLLLSLASELCQKLSYPPENRKFLSSGKRCLKLDRRGFETQNSKSPATLPHKAIPEIRKSDEMFWPLAFEPVGERARRIRASESPQRADRVGKREPTRLRGRPQFSKRKSLMGTWLVAGLGSQSPQRALTEAATTQEVKRSISHPSEMTAR